MANRSHIVSYEDARRASYERRSVASSSRARAVPERGSRDASNRMEASAKRRSVRDDAASRTRRDARPAVYGRNDLRDQEAEPAKRQSLSEKAAERKKARSKAKAERKYHQQFEAGSSRNRGGSGHQAGNGEGGPRAAVYRGEMGSRQRRATRLQDEASPSSSPSVKAKRNRMHPVALVTAAVSLCVVCACVFLYPAAQQYYVTVREHDRLQAEYEAVVSRNEALQGKLTSLSTEEGLRQYVHERYGWVSEDENAVVVQGLSESAGNGLSGVAANVVPGSVQAPETWYSSTLDPVFGYQR